MCTNVHGASSSCSAYHTVVASKRVVRFLDDDGDNVSLAETDSVGSCAVTEDDTLELDRDGSCHHVPAEICDACPHCDDHCDDKECKTCQQKSAQHSKESPSSSPFLFSACTKQTITLNTPKVCHNSNKNVQYYTVCQVRRHNHEGSAWILVGDDIYDATPYIHSHPGGVESILRRAGGARDCSSDFQFHSKRAQQLFKRLHVGKLKRCEGDVSSPRNPHPTNKNWWMFW